LLTSLLVVPFINFLYRVRFLRRAQTTHDFLGIRSKIFDRFNKHKVGTPVGGGLLIIFVVSLLYAVVFPLITFLGVFVSSHFPIKEELNVLFFTFIGFGLLGLYDDIKKLFGFKIFRVFWFASTS